MLESRNILHLIHEKGKKNNETNESDVTKSKKFREELGRLPSVELDVLYEEKKYSWAPWQLTAANGERAFRMGITNINQAAKICRAMENGYGLRQVEKNGKLVYVGHEGRIYYESSITVH